jgi:BirA family transcriptional regulator, biotin operon repressor / biotin---[acetyl-CoA-carboxylase] ligase
MSSLKIHHFESVGSTNDVLKSMVDAPELTCVTADQQTSGRGRRSRSWLSTAGDGLYLSILLRPRLNAGELPVLGLMSAVVVAETLVAYGITSMDIKWPNDVLIETRKVAGILAEVVGAAPDQRVILGIGVNLNHGSFPAELVETATSVRMAIGRQIDVIEFRNALLDRFENWYQRICEKGASEVIARWQKLSSYARGRQVVVTVDDQRIEGETAGLTASGALRLRMEDGEVKTLAAGDVSSVRTQAKA